MTADRIERATLETLAERAPLHVMDIAEQVSEHPVAVDQACARLHDTGDILSVGLGRYDITDRGQRRRDELRDGRQQTESPS